MRALRNIIWSILLCLATVVLFSGCGFTGYRAHSLGAPRAIYHTVRAGETLQAIADRYAVHYVQVARLNGIRNVNDLSIGQKLLIAYSFGGGVGSPEEDSALVYNGKLAWPVPRGKLVSRFGQRGSKFHDGIDIAAPVGTPVYAAHSGTVAYAGDRLTGYGNLIIVKEISSGITTVYAHNDRMFVSPGDKVKRGDTIAEIGMTGRTSGPHLHFEVRMLDTKRRYVAIDPLPFLLTKTQKNKPNSRINNNLDRVLKPKSS